MARRTLHHHKRLSFRNFVTSINRFTDPSYVWKKIRVFQDSKSVVEWSRWQGVDRDKVVMDKIDELAPQ